MYCGTSTASPKCLRCFGALWDASAIGRRRLVGHGCDVVVESVLQRVCSTPRQRVVSSLGKSNEQNALCMILSLFQPLGFWAYKRRLVLVKIWAWPWPRSVCWAGRPAMR